MKPMLAAKTDGKDLRYPMFASPKLDGVRAIVQGGRVYSRSLKLIPNGHTQAALGKPALNGLDGELCVGPSMAPDVYRQTTSGVMSEAGVPPVCFHVFDRYDLKLPFYRRYEKIVEFAKVRSSGVLQIVPHKLLTCYEELVAYEQDALALGYEGVMLRHPEGPYKEGRSTEREAWLLKLKRFNDSEAIVLEILELMHNDNEAKVNKLGKTERSSHKANKRGGDMMGALRVRDVNSKVEFDIGTGFDTDMRRLIWMNASKYKGQLVKYKFFPGGVKEKPRFPVFLGWRASMDCSSTRIR